MQLYHAGFSKVPICIYRHIWPHVLKKNIDLPCSSLQVQIFQIFIYMLNFMQMNNSIEGNEVPMKLLIGLSMGVEVRLLSGSLLQNYELFRERILSASVFIKCLT